MPVHQPLRLIIAGSRRLPKGEAPRLLIRFLAELEPDTTVFLRRGQKTQAGDFELAVAALCEILNLEYEWREPIPSEDHPGRASVFRRDIEMVEDCDFAVLFFTTQEHEEGYSGTFHLLDKCLDVGRPVHAYTVGQLTGDVERVGDYDPLHQFDHLALAV